MRYFILLPLLLMTLQVFTIQPLQAQDEEEQKEKVSFDEAFKEIKTIMFLTDKQDAINRRQAKLDKVLIGFLETDFMKKFKEMRLESESLMATFKTYQDELSPSDVSRVKKAYSMMADKFNLQLNAIKLDFLDKKILSTIKNNPKMYSDALKNNLRELKEEYAQTVERAVYDVTGSDTYSLGPLMAIMDIINFSVQFANYLSQISYDARKVKEEHLDKYFIEPFSFKPWDKIEASQGNIQKVREDEEEASVGLDPFGEKN
ncbi:MAG: hypothetical protein R2828_05480 [Saprospiraceae bacterium]